MCCKTVTLMAALFSAALCMRQSAYAQEKAEPTNIRITGSVLQKDRIPLGVNMETQYDLKCITAQNFEGFNHRICLFGELYADGFVPYDIGWLNAKPEALDFYKGAEVTILSGPHKWQKKKIKELTIKHNMLTYPNNPVQKDVSFIGFETPLENFDESLRVDVASIKSNKGDAAEKDPYKFSGVLIENNRPDSGGFDSPETAGPRSEDGWAFEHSDIPPGTKGKTAFLFKGVGSKCSLRLQGKAYGVKHSHADCSGVWKVSFWAKAKGGAGKIVFAPMGGGISALNASVPIGPEWKKYEQVYDLTGKLPEVKTAEDVLKVKEKMGLNMYAEGGEVLVDDVVMWQEGHKNPTAFRDELVEVLKEARVGSLRLVGVGGDTMANSLLPTIEKTAKTGGMQLEGGRAGKGAGKQPYTIHELYGLCEYLGCEAWYNINGTMLLEEMDLLMEYIGGPASTAGGKIRASQGHPKPWSETLKGINIQFGNEIWNFNGWRQSSFNGRDYWQDLIARAKKSPYYKPHVKFHVDGQNRIGDYNIQLLKNVPNADSLTIAPYVGDGIKSKLFTTCTEKEPLYRWFMTRPYTENLYHPGMLAQADYCKKNGYKLSCYENGYHSNKLIAEDGTLKNFAYYCGNKQTDRKVIEERAKDPDLQRLNEVLVSQGPGVGVVNGFLAIMRDLGVREHNLYSFEGEFFCFKLWGTVLNVRPEIRRFRPIWLSLSTANKAILPDLLETVQSGASPVFESPLPEKWDKPYPCIWSYAFRDGKKRSIILVNLNLTQALPVAVSFDGTPAGDAQMWQVTGDRFDGNNEMEKIKPEVVVKQDKIAGFASGRTMSLPPASMTSMCWEEK